MKYRVTGQVTISVSTVVEAQNKGEAILESYKRDLQSLPSSHHEDDTREWCHSGELDGSVRVVDVEEEA